MLKYTATFCGLATTTFLIGFALYQFRYTPVSESADVQMLSKQVEANYPDFAKGGIGAGVFLWDRRRHRLCISTFKNGHMACSQDELLWLISVDAESNSHGELSRTLLLGPSTKGTPAKSR